MVLCKVRVGIGVMGMLFGVMGGTASAQGFQRTCFTESNAGDALALRVDDQGRYHLIRGAFASGDILYTVMDPADLSANAVRTRTLERAANRFPRQLLGADLLLRDDEPAACYFAGNRLRIATLVENAWQIIDVAGGPELGDYCRLFVQDGEVGVLVQRDGVLQEGIQQPNGIWDFAIVDDVGLTGRNLHLYQADENHLVAIYQAEDVGRTRVAWRTPDVGWQTVELASDLAARSGESPRVVGVQGDEIYVISGFEGTRDGQAPVADAGYLIGV
ncbi:MAG: hypothetical protein VX589_07835, partial [Myxococcota bacterium]|nr:hypothetical protein [Myxococcota bacterium]